MHCPDFSYFCCWLRRILTLYHLRFFVWEPIGHHDRIVYDVSFLGWISLNVNFILSYFHLVYYKHQKEN